MALFDRVADRIIARAVRTPYFHIPSYMERYWLLPYGNGPIAIRVHHILRSDNDRVYHDHPWPYIRVILRNSYIEHCPVFRDDMYVGTVSKAYGAGHIAYRSARSWHRLELLPGTTAWTLFISGPKVRSWGFLAEPKYKVYWREYLNDWGREGSVHEGDGGT